MERTDIEIERSPSRCPYCHDSIDAAEEDWLACAECLARHHEECWQEIGRCSSCAGTRTLALGGAAAAAPRPPRKKPFLTRRSRLAIQSVLSWGAWIGLGLAAYHWLYPTFGCWVFLFALVLAHETDEATKALLGIGKKGRKRKKKAPPKAPPDKGAE